MNQSMGREMYSHTHIFPTVGSHSTGQNVSCFYEAGIFTIVFTKIQTLYIIKNQTMSSTPSFSKIYFNPVTASTFRSSNLSLSLKIWNQIFVFFSHLFHECYIIGLIYPNRDSKYEGISKSFRTGRLERELQMIQLSATRCSYIAILWVNLVSFAAITLFVASQRVFIVVSVYFVIDSVRKHLDTPSYEATSLWNFFQLSVHLS
jgi:hypothetical protein